MPQGHQARITQGLDEHNLHGKRRLASGGRSQTNVFWTNPQGYRLTSLGLPVRSYGRGEQQAPIVAGEAELAILCQQVAVRKIHRRPTHEAGDKTVRRLLINSQRSIQLLYDPP